MNGESGIWFYILVREGNQDVVFSAGSSGHVFSFIVKFVVAGLGASDQLGQRVVLWEDRY